MELLLPGLAVLGAAAIGYGNGGQFAPMAALSIPTGLALASFASARLRASAGASRSTIASAGGVAMPGPRREPRAPAPIAEAEFRRGEAEYDVRGPRAEGRIDPEIAGIRVS